MSTPADELRAVEALSSPSGGAPPALDFLVGGDEMGARVRSHDWSQTPVGAPLQWPQSLKTAVSICLGSRHPIVLWWGRSDYTEFYNDAYIAFLGAGKHPGFLGRSGRECWSEIWPVIGPMLEGVFATGEATWSEDLLLTLDRNLPREETYFTFSYSPIRGDDGSISGIFCACNETTARVIGERRLRTLRDLSRMEVATQSDTACEIAARTLADNPGDIPFALIYMLEDDNRHARLVASTGLTPGGVASPLRIAVESAPSSAPAWPLRHAIDTGSAQLVLDAAKTFGPLPGGLWPDSCEAVLVVPILAPGQTGPTGFLVSGLSPRRVFDADYRGFLNLVAGHIGTSVTNARAFEETHKRAEALAELDRAKTLFFSNVSHEFRTPLTLMLGPLEEALASDLPAGERDRIDLAHRNSLRLLKLVNALLDFSRIEAGRAQATYQPVDLAALTTDLASNFRSACERAGLKLGVDCPQLDRPVFVDRDMWEKIVLNLLSNAFKFTFAGEIAVSLRPSGGQVELIVRDTGVGIPEHELPRVFERFHRIEGQKSRTYEGSGIGLALVQELVKLHGGTIRADSAAGAGTRFTIRLPFGKAHLPPDRIGAERGLASTAVRAEAFVEEALRWLPDEPRQPAGTSESDTPSVLASPGAGARILVADDNADMRAYVRQLLDRDYAVEAVTDGQAALDAAAARRPDLVLADVMMPRLDGFGLLRAMRGDPALRDIPIVMVSARAGEESRAEGLDAGADDYLVKPFSARELKARVGAVLNLARVRRHSMVALRRSEAVLAAQNEALQAAMNGAPLAGSLGVLVRCAVAQAEGEARAGFYIVDAAGTGLHHIVGMSEAYARCVDGFPIGPDSVACGLVAHSGQPVIAADVTKDPRWTSWRWLARDHGYRACWSFPIETTAGKVVGTFSLYYAEPREPAPRDLELAASLTRAGAIIISRHQEAQARLEAQEEVQRQATQFETLLNNAPLGVFLVDARFRIVQVNPIALSAFGDIPGGVVGRDFGEINHILWPATYAEEIVRIFRQTLETGEPCIMPESIEERRDRGVIEYYEWQVYRILLPSGTYGIVCYFRDIAAQVSARERMKLLLDELNHRVKNTLATIQSIAVQTLRNAASTADGRYALEERLVALSKAHDVLTREHWEGASLNELVVDALSAYAAESAQPRFEIAGPDIKLRPKAALALSLALHELATNAVKYGALSSEAGSVAINWHLAQNGTRRFHMRWAESGGPPVAVPDKRGFGSRLIEQGLSQDLAGEARLRFDEHGLVCTIDASLEDIAGG